MCLNFFFAFLMFQFLASQRFKSRLNFSTVPVRRQSGSDLAPQQLNFPFSVSQPIRHKDQLIYRE